MQTTNALRCRTQSLDFRPSVTIHRGEDIEKKEGRLKTKFRFLRRPFA
ncbi:hypothetical protein MCC93_11750 [Morococcus cerebrosus]|uniref:Uncharacterized protein n=1 Tax=Morococcus cerebrosus TaxID=1056807 RepID=A0A0C1GQ54_9NEIS|nr:hypothetical protein MCC93_11750 [Morococcus cerebrosus]